MGVDRHRQFRLASLVFLLLLCIILLYATLRSGGDQIETDNESLGPIGRSMVEMLIGGQHSDLAFTTFIPSEAVLKRLLTNSSSGGNRQALLSRLLASSSIPTRITSETLIPGEQLQVESISGYRFSLGMDLKRERGLLVNGIRCVAKDLTIGRTSMAHIVKKVIVDPEFRRSVFDQDRTM